MDWQNDRMGASKGIGITREKTDFFFSNKRRQTKIGLVSWAAGSVIKKATESLQSPQKRIQNHYSGSAG
jgi:hypothetical protein